MRMKKGTTHQFQPSSVRIFERDLYLEVCEYRKTKYLNRSHLICDESLKEPLKMKGLIKGGFVESNKQMSRDL